MMGVFTFVEDTVPPGTCKKTRGCSGTFAFLAACCFVHNAFRAARILAWAVAFACAAPLADWAAFAWVV